MSDEMKGKMQVNNAESRCSVRVDDCRRVMIVGRWRRQRGRVFRAPGYGRSWELVRSL